LVLVWVSSISPNFSPSGQKNFIRVRSKSNRIKDGSASYLLRVKLCLLQSLSLCPTPNPKSFEAFILLKFFILNTWNLLVCFYTHISARSSAPIPVQVKSNTVLIQFIFIFPRGSKKFLSAGSKSTQVKGRSASYLLRVKIMLATGPISMS